LAIPAFLVCLQLLPNAAVAAEVEIYTASYCSECKRAKAYMYANRIVFNEHDIEKDIERRREFYARGGKAIPYIFVNGQAMHGFDVERFERLRTAYK
jgi:glutaredoxin